VSEAPRIVVTGVGLHTGHGDTAATWAALGENRSALTCDHAWRLLGSEPGATAEPVFPAAPAPEPSPVEFLTDRKMVKYMGPCTQMAVLAAGRALRDAGLLGADAAAEREAMGLFLATGPIAFDVEQALASFDEQGAADVLALRNDGLRRCHPLLPFKMLLNMPLGLVSIVFGIKGPNFILYPDAEQGACALAHALRALRRGRCTAALVGGSACSLGLAPIMNLHWAGRLASSVAEAQPFSACHQGWAPADQAAFLVLETEAHASHRGASAYASLDHVEVLGAGAEYHLWAAFTGLAASEVFFCTGSSIPTDLASQRQRLRARWTQSATLASADGLLGVAPAASFLLATALACLSLRQGRLPASLAENGVDCPVAEALVSFVGAEGVAAAALTGRIS
jgi:3-oxoacyl-(acyl-carrier-protein) synthase